MGKAFTRYLVVSSQVAEQCNTTNFLPRLLASLMWEPWLGLHGKATWPGEWTRLAETRNGWDEPLFQLNITNVRAAVRSATHAILYSHQCILDRLD